MNSTYAQKLSSAKNVSDSKASSVLDNSAQGESLQRHADLANGAAQCASLSPRPNNTGMPDDLKSGIESLSGFSMDDVRVHYNSSKPATVQALAYTQGTNIHVAPGQEKCLPHEAWHVAQQMAGRVSPTTNINGMPVNDNAALEHEADVMGAKAVQCKKNDDVACLITTNQDKTIQRNPLVKFFQGFHEEDGVEGRVGDIVEFSGLHYDDCKDFHIAFETFGNDVAQLVELYDRVIRSFNGKATVVIGVNSEAILNKNVDGGRGFYKSEAEYKAQPGISFDVDEVSKIGEIPPELLDKVNALRAIVPAEKHKIVICPFVYDGRYNQGGDYNMPYCEIRRNLMWIAEQKATISAAPQLYRWIDRDCRDDLSIAHFNKRKSRKIPDSSILTAAYNWRGRYQAPERSSPKVLFEIGMKNQMIDFVNVYEREARKMYFNIRERFNASGLIDEDGEKKYYLPETLLYFTPSAHTRAMDSLSKQTSKQSGESAIAIGEGGAYLHFMDYTCSKPLKFRDGMSYFYSIESVFPPEKVDAVSLDDFSVALKQLRQTAFNDDKWQFIDETAQSMWKDYKIFQIAALYKIYTQLWHGYETFAGNGKKSG